MLSSVLCLMDMYGYFSRVQKANGIANNSNDSIKQEPGKSEKKIDDCVVV
jgi:hypothetical protein